MQHNFVFQLIFYPFQDKINKLQIRVQTSEDSSRILQTRMLIYYLYRFQTSEDSSRILQTRMLIYHLYKFKTSENNLRVLQTRMLIYRLFRLNFWKQFTDSPNTDVNPLIIQDPPIQRYSKTWTPF